MVSTDLISDMLVRIKNAASSRKDQLLFPLSKKVLAVAQTLERAGYLEVLPRKGKKMGKFIEAKLLYVNGAPRFKGAKRISSVSKRVYRNIASVTSVKSGFGSLIVSTSKGVLTDKEAKKENVGGEALFQIW